MQLPMNKNIIKEQMEKKLTVFSWMHPVAAFLLMFVLVPLGILCGVMFAAMIFSAPMLLSAGCNDLNAALMLSGFC